MKICVYGAGAIGGFIGAELSRVSGLNVSLIARGPHLDAIRNNGIKLIINDEERVSSPFATDNPAELGVQDYIIMTLKSHQAWEVAENIAPLLDQKTAVVTCQNGIPWWYFFNIEGPFKNYRIKCIDPNNIQWDTITPERIIGCVVYPATEIIRPGVIKHMEGNRFSLGEPSGVQTERISRISKALISAGLKAPIRNNIRQEIWTKLIGNLAFNPLSVITGETLDTLASKKENKDIAYAAMKEASLIMNKLQIPLNISIDQRIEGTAKVGAHKTSMLQDYERGKELELDALIVTVKEIGDLYGIKTPTIDIILNKVIERISKNN